MILLVLVGCTLFFIWSNSLESAEASSDKSGRVVKIVKPIIDPADKMDIETVTRLVRKFAHFSEFALLGAEIWFLVYTFDRFKRATRLSFVLSVTLAFVAAIADELIQLTSAGRSCQFADMLIDLAGIVIGVVFAFGVRFVFLVIYNRISCKRSADM